MISTRRLLIELLHLRPIILLSGKFLSLLPHLTDLEINSCDFHDDFYKEIADRASSSQIQKFIISYLYLHDDQSSSGYLGKFLSLLSHLTDLTINSCSFHDDFYKEIADQASSSQNPYFREKEHISMLQEWSVRKQQRQQLQQQQWWLEQRQQQQQQRCNNNDGG
ncbi:uncharacterized protein LOC115925271 [Strongylocentrotus purpuratus]|uniref:Uncharacterized protein n=1 Tax=Strongylocentrotus purpuratus TaxID=7668 RepID=A0A7M7P719_STRPU|nr:uncharacterized protein LOC115925271 [Strongylocentrotus purpuratus]